MKMPFEYSSVPMAPSQSTGDLASRSRKFPAIFLRIQEGAGECIWTAFSRKPLDMRWEVALMYEAFPESFSSQQKEETHEYLCAPSSRPFQASAFDRWWRIVRPDSSRGADPDRKTTGRNYREPTAALRSFRPDWRHQHRRHPGCRTVPRTEGRATADRKSTRLNSSHVRISYAVFCL